MDIRILKPMAGYGHFVRGGPYLFSLCEGDVASVDDEVARKWIASGLAAAAASEARAPESAALAVPRNAMSPTARLKGRPR